MNLVIIYWRILSYFVLIPLFILISIILTIINAFSTCFFDRGVGQINAGTLGVAHTFRCSVVSESPLLLSSCISDSLSASQSSSLLFKLSRSPFQLSQFAVCEMLSGELSTSLSAGWQSTWFIQQTFNTSVRLPVQSFADKAVGTGDYSDNLNAAAPLCSKCDQDAMTISSVSEM